METQDLIRSLFVSETNALGILDIFLAITIPFALCMLIGLFYRNSARLNVYSANFIISLPLFGALSSIITLLIGSNIARAFGLVGALSLIRFRTAVKEPLDTIYLFWCLAVGMACGTGFYLAASMIVLLCGSYMVLLQVTKFGQSSKVYLVLKAEFSSNISEADLSHFEKFCRKIFSNIEPINIYSSANQSFNEHVYSVKLKKRMGTQQLMSRVKEFEGVQNVEFVSQDSALFH